MNRERFVATMVRFGIPPDGIITDATEADIAAFLAPLRPGPGIDPPAFPSGFVPYPWSGRSGSSAPHEEYDGIAAAFRKFAEAFGRVPQVDALYFADRDYGWLDANSIGPRPGGAGIQ